MIQLQKRLLPALALCLVLGGVVFVRAGAQTPTGVSNAGRATNSAQAAATKPSPLVARVRDTGFIQVQTSGFDALSPDQKLDAYWLSMAAIAVNPIAYDQNSSYGLREKHLL